MTQPTPNDSKLQTFQDLTTGYQKMPKPKTSDTLPNMFCKKCGSDTIYKTLNYVYANLLPFNCLNCGLLSAKEITEGVI